MSINGGTLLSHSYDIVLTLTVFLRIFNVFLSFHVGSVKNREVSTMDTHQIGHENNYQRIRRDYNWRLLREALRVALAQTPFSRNTSNFNFIAL